MQLTPTYSIYRNDVKIKEKHQELNDNQKAELIKNVCANHIHIEPEILVAKTRKREIVEARQIAMALTKLNTGLTLKNIGLRYGGRDHSTVIHALQTIQDLVDTDKAFHQKVLGFQMDVEMYCRLQNKF